MNHNTSESSQQQPHHSPSNAEDNTNPFHREDLPRPDPKETNPFLHQQQQEPHLYPPVCAPEPEEKIPVPEKTVSPPPVTATAIPSSSSSSAPPPPPVEQEKWGTCVMGSPAVPTVHPDNKKAALWGATGEVAHQHHHPYLQYSPIERPASGQTSTGSSSPMENILHTFNSWSNKAETMASNIWHNLKTGQSVSGAAWAKVNLRAKAITGGGFESLYKQTFSTFPNETLRKTFACYLSTSTGPVAGTLYLSNIHAAFCSDRPLSFTAPSGQVTWSYYKVFVPLGKIGAVSPVVMRENQSEKYIQIVTLEGHDFWFMGFVNYDKACRHLTESVSAFVASGVAVYQPPPHEQPSNDAVHL
ncbi:hypothetical protein CDL15_Pgr005584 [Punica granatum]|uniref:GRAM domain-containing protein n=1 Tax=Punica granatum TaxID=22663 RepID=A0A218WEY7_PUNGR|nr:hypothetical protein CDL15_Pgr005584 [Punica granatum]